MEKFDLTRPHKFAHNFARHDAEIVLKDHSPILKLMLFSCGFFLQLDEKYLVEIMSFNKII